MIIKEILKENKGLIICLILATSVLVISLFDLSNEFNFQKKNEDDHWQSAIKDLDTFTGKNPEDCLDLSSHLQDHYNTDMSKDTYWYNYLAHEYNKALELHCSSLPKPISIIQDSYK